MRHVTLRFTKDELRQSYYFFAGLKDEPEKLTSNEGILKWFSPDELDGLEMPFTAEYVFEHYIKTGRHDSLLYSGTATSAGVDFIPLT